MNISLLPEKQLEEYAEILEEQGDKKAAFKVYLTLAKIYDNHDAYMKAEKLAPDEKTRMSILAQIVAKAKNTPQGTYYQMRFGIKMINSGKIAEGIQTLKGVDADKLDKKGITEYLRMLPYFKNEPILRQEALDILTEYYSDNLEIHQKLMNSMLKSADKKMCEEFFRQEYIRYPKNPIANYMFANFQNNPKSKLALYQNAVKLSPDFYEAQLALGIFYINQQHWREAIKCFYKCAKLKPRNKEPRYYSTIAKIKTTKTSSALRAYELFLKNIRTPAEEISKQMVLLSQYMSDEKYALIYLKKAEKIPSLNQFCLEQKIRIHLIYKTIQEKDFTDTKNSLIKQYYTIYLLGKGKFREIINIPTKREDFPDFWKVFICWKQGIPSWEQNSYLLINRNKDNILISTIAKLWLKKISLSEAELMLEKVDYIDKPLLSIMIAEQYRKKKETLKSKIFFRKALTYSNPNIYIHVADYLRKH